MTSIVKAAPSAMRPTVAVPARFTKGSAAVQHCARAGTKSVRVFFPNKTAVVVVCCKAGFNVLTVEAGTLFQLLRVVLTVVTSRSCR